MKKYLLSLWVFVFSITVLGMKLHQSPTRKSLPYQNIQSLQLREIPFWQGFIDSIATIWSPKFLESETIIFGDITDHRLAVVDRVEHTIRFIGRSGEGPSEFESPETIAVNQEKGFAVWDGRQLRLSLFDHSLQFVKMLRLEMGVSWHSVSMDFLNDSILVFVPGMLHSESKFSEQVALIPASFDSYSLFSSPCGIEIQDDRVAAISDLCYRTVGIGTNQTILIAYHHNYQLKRYSRTGQLLWDSGSLDEEFRAPTYRAMRDRIGFTGQIFNLIDALMELERGGFVIGAGFISGGFRNRSVLDLRDIEGNLLQRISIPDGLTIGDFRVEGDQLLVLAYHFGRFNWPTIRLFSVSLDS